MIVLYLPCLIPGESWASEYVLNIENRCTLGSIEQVRFPDMEIRFDLQSGDFLLPALSVQPLVENAIKHGLMKLPGYLMKPISPEEVQEEIDYIKGIKTKENRLTVKCFGNFEVYSHGEKLVFKRTKTKELLAFLVDRKDAGMDAIV